MGTNEMKKIKTQFPEIYEEMTRLAIQRHKIHQIIISKFFTNYLNWAKSLQGESSDSDVDSNSDSVDVSSISSSVHSYISEIYQLSNVLDIIDSRDFNDLYTQARAKLKMEKKDPVPRIQRRKDLRH